MRQKTVNKIRGRIASLELKHAEISTLVDHLYYVYQSSDCIREAKKKKLALKDEIVKLRKSIVV